MDSKALASATMLILFVQYNVWLYVEYGFAQSNLEMYGFNWGIL